MHKPFASSSTYANDPNNIDENSKTLKRYMRSVKEAQQVHSVLCFHVKNANQYWRENSSGHNSGNVNHSGHNMQCSVHAYPVYSINQYSYCDNDSYSTQNITGACGLLFIVNCSCTYIINGET